MDHSSYPMREWSVVPGHSITSKQRTTIGQLQLMDPQLAGLYSHGLYLLCQDPMPGDIYLLAHCGRELSRGVLQRLEENTQSVMRQSPHCDSSQTSSQNRSRIAAVLKLTTTDPRVSEWHKIHKCFAAKAHWRYSAPEKRDVTALRGAFERFSNLLHGLIAPYFNTEKKLDSLLAVSCPTIEHVMQLHNLQLRIAQRDYFFRYASPMWAQPLMDGNFFRSAPDWQMALVQGWHTRNWPEGEYLVRVANDIPNLVADIIKTLPLSNDNPVVWDAVAKAATRLPPKLAAQMVPRLITAIKTKPTSCLHSFRMCVVFRTSVVDLAVMLAMAGCDDCAFDLVDHLFWVVDSIPKDENLRFTLRTEWMFPRLRGLHRYDEFCTRVVTALGTIDPERTFSLLLKKIHKIQQLSDSSSRRSLWRPLKRLDARRHQEDIASALIASAIHLIYRVAESKSDAQSTEWIITALDSDRYDDELFLRIRYLILSRVGQYFPNQLDQVLQSKEARNPGYRMSEFAELFRRQFRNATKEARKQYVDAVTTEINSHQQKRILTFFRGRIPSDFECLARKYGVLSLEPSYQEQQMAEIGSYSEDRSLPRRTRKTLVSVDQLSSWSVEEVIAFLHDHQLYQEKYPILDLPIDFSDYAKENVPKALGLLERGVEGGLDAIIIESILDGLAEAAKMKSAIDWHQVLFGVETITRHLATLDESRTADIEQWCRVVGRAAWLISEGCRSDSIPLEITAKIWRLLDEATRIPSIWQAAGLQDRSLGEVISAQLNHASGNIAHAVFSLTLTDYRIRTQDSSETSKLEARRVIQKSLLPILDRWLKDERPNNAISRAVMGGYLPQLYLLVPEWMTTHAIDLFRESFENPAQQPTWTTYISRATLYDKVFCDLRPWYKKAIEQADVWNTAMGCVREMLKPTEKLAFHLVIAFLKNLISVGDEDELLETAYANLSCTDWDRAYWHIYRSWTDAEDPVPITLSRKVVELWEWRISELKNSKRSTHIIEQAKTLWWFFETPHIDDADRIRLGQVTARLAKGRVGTYLNWERMLRLARIDLDGVFDIATHVLRTQKYVPTEDVKPFFSFLLQVGSGDIRIRARYLINQLGERGFRDLRELL